MSVRTCNYYIHNENINIYYQVKIRIRNVVQPKFRLV